MKNFFAISVDNSDTSNWKCSGLKIHTDTLTSVQYLSNTKGGLYPRIDSTGKVITIQRK